jgi:hypothetical protein
MKIAERKQFHTEEFIRFDTPSTRVNGPR